MISKKKFDRIANKVKLECACKGLGCHTCATKVSRLKLYSESNIPIKYWSLPFKNFKGDPNFAEKVRDMLRNIEDVYDDGKSYAFTGNLGTGKTYAATCILKKALVSNFSGKYIQMAEIVNTLLSEYNNQEFLEFLTTVDFLVIDEMDQRWVFPSEKVERIFSSTLEYILRTRFQNGMPTFVCSNSVNIDTVLTGDFARAFGSLRNMYMDVIIVGGKDYRKHGKS